MPNALSIAFATSNPYIGYECAKSDVVGSVAISTVQITHDGGRTWEKLPTFTLPAERQCRLSVNPTDAHDIVLIAPTFTEGGASINHIYRSHDAGQTWGEMTVPEGAAPGGFAMTWTDSTLFLTIVSPDNSDGGHEIAASVQGRPITWVDATGHFAAHLNIGVFFALGETYYARIDRYEGGSIYELTNDGGKTWSTFNPPADMPPVVWTQADGKSLVGFDGKDVVISSDRGNTWQALPVLSGIATNNVEAMFVGSLSSPDGTIYSLQLSNSDVGEGDANIYKLPHGGQQWQTLHIMNPTTFPTISWDTQGHPVAFWLCGSPGTLLNAPSGGYYHSA